MNSPQDWKAEKVLVASAELTVALGTGLGLGTRNSVVNMKKTDFKLEVGKESGFQWTGHKITL